MARPLRLEFAGALYHVTSRGDRREDIFLCEADRRDWLDVLGTVCERFNWVVHAFCQMTNHYHLLVETVDGNLSKGMRQLNGWYTQRVNRRHGLAGHPFQGHYKAILVQKEAYLLELARYVVLNPVRARMVSAIADWRWSSYPMVMGQEPAARWLDADWLLGQFATERSQARRAYREFVMLGMGAPSPWQAVRHQLLLGDDAFVRSHAQSRGDEVLREVSMAQRRAIAWPLEEYRARYPDRDEAMARAYLSGAYSMAAIGQHFEVHCMTVSRAVRKHETRLATLQEAWT
ncbi:transposase [Thermithiobacillus tepidarius DSM 3134]|uniref:transposase n=1 Tax=Thermithiobacillus tepidarius TaxID=929 RepID=UPI0004293A9F|nr:transposase [Thermithiobacillus tepidarius]